MDSAVNGYSNDIRIIYEMSIRVELDFGSSSGSSLTKEPFTVYISGNDEYGEMSEAGRSDVNIKAVVNPKTHQILLVRLPEIIMWRYRTFRRSERQTDSCGTLWNRCVNGNSEPAV